MYIRTLPISEIEGHILVHNVAGRNGRKILKKGTPLGSEEVARLQDEGHEMVEVAVLEAEDVWEDDAASAIADALAERAGNGTIVLQATRAVAGRVNFHIEETCVLYIDEARLLSLNSLPGVTLATRPAWSLLGRDLDSTQVATLKIIPYALPRTTVDEARRRAQGILRLAPLRKQRVALLVTADEGSRERLAGQFARPTQQRLARLGSTLDTVHCVRHEEEAISDAALELLATHDALIIGGQTSIMDIRDTTPRALTAIGADVTLHGAPVEPGNLLALAYAGEQWIMCAPGCARSPSHNVVDLVLPRLLAGERIGQQQIAALGLGGLLQG